MRPHTQFHFANVFLLGINGTTFYTKCQVKTTRYYQKKRRIFLTIGKFGADIRV